MSEQDFLMDAYKKLYTYFGPRHWWPAETDFEVIIGAILTQNVTWKSVCIAINKLKANGLMSIKALNDVDEDLLGELIKSTRYYKQKAKKLKEFCNYVMENYESDIYKFFKKDVMTLRKELLSIYGIGYETADSIILYAAHKPIFVVDAYTRRIYSRLGKFDMDIKYEDMRRYFMDNLEEDVQLFNEYHALIDALGNRICLNKKPRCEECPLNSMCKIGHHS